MTRKKKADTQTEAAWDKLEDAHEPEATEPAPEGEAQVTMSNAETKEIEMSIDVDLTNEEIVAYAHAASTANRELTAVEMDFDRVKSDHKERVGGFETEIRDALLAIERGKISKRVKCLEVRDYAAKTVRILNGEIVVAERTMTASELQQDLFPKEEVDENGISKQVIDESHLDAPQENELAL